MPFGLMNALASFQGYINKILAKKLDIFVIVYLDDIFIYTDDDGNRYVTAIWWVLEQLRKFLLNANLKMCQFYSERNLVPRLCGVLKKHLHGRQKNWDSEAMAWISVNMRYPSFFWICQLLLTIYPKIQSDSCTTYLNAENLKYQVNRSQKKCSRG